MASTRVERSPQILAEIFKHLQPQVSTPTQKLLVAEQKIQKELRGTLYSASMASRVISEHSLAVLWQELDDVRHLLSLFPQFRPCYRGSRALVCTSLVSSINVMYYADHALDATRGYHSGNLATLPSIREPYPGSPPGNLGTHTSVYLESHLPLVRSPTFTPESRGFVHALHSRPGPRDDDVRHSIPAQSAP